MKISKRVRDEAADFCAAIASAEFADPAYACSCAPCMFSAVGGVSEYAYQLAIAARESVPNALYPGFGENYGLRFAEAECLLRCGWSP